MWNYAHELITVDSLYRFRDIGAEKLENSGFLTDLSAFPPHDPSEFEDETILQNLEGSV